MIRTGSRAALLIAVGALTAACVEIPDAGSRPTQGNPAPEVVGATLAGDSVALSALRGEPVLLNIWATWCAPCRREMPYLQELHERYGPRGLRVVGVTVDGGSARSQVEDFTADVGVDYEIVLDPRGRSMDAFQVVGLPATFLIDSDGIIRLARYGEVTEADTAFHEALDALVGT